MELPPLPEPVFHGVSRGGLLRQDGYTAEQMREYGAACVAANSAALCEYLEGWAGPERFSTTAAAKQRRALLLEVAEVVRTAHRSRRTRDDQRRV